MTARQLTLLAARLLVALPLAACAAAQPAGDATSAGTPGAAPAAGQDARPAAAVPAAGSNAAPASAAAAAAGAPAQSSDAARSATPAPRATAPAPARAASAGTPRPAAVSAPTANPDTNSSARPASTAPADTSGATAPATPPSDVTAPNPAAPGMAAPGTVSPGTAIPGAATPAPVTMPASSSTGSLLQTLLALLLVLAVLGGLAWFLKRYGPKTGGGNANLRVVGSLNLGGRERVLVVEVGGQWIVLGASPGRINALATMPRQDGLEGASANAQLAPHGSVAPAHSFADWLKQTIDKRK